jgi:hypothetical protein
MSKQNEQKERTGKKIQLHHNHEKFLCSTMLFSLHNEKCVIGDKQLDLTWLSCCESYILLSVFSSHLFPSTSTITRPLAYREFPLLSNQYYKVVVGTFNIVLSFISLMLSERRRFIFTVSWLCDDHISAETFVVKGFSIMRYYSPLSARAMTAPSPRCRRTAVFKNWHDLYCLPRVGWRFADEDGYRSKEPINVSNVPSSLFLRAAVSCVETAHPTSLMLRLCGSPVSWVR